MPISPALYSSKTELWETPQALFDELNAEFHFTVDVCALPENAKCDRYYTPEQDGLAQKWEGVCWCNPPIRPGNRSMGEKGRHLTCYNSHAFTRQNRHKMVS